MYVTFAHAEDFIEVFHGLSPLEFLGVMLIGLPTRFIVRKAHVAILAILALKRFRAVRYGGATRHALCAGLEALRIEMSLEHF